ncbi:MAG: dihydrodipicolinate synthase family protein [Candidatus Aenigmarchaeota archaeon]|nr:dihydrodipicolinate synthase family protein [Candidatus Aenigmarchaeota archaeon]
MLQKFEGAISALPVPFHPDGRINWYELDRWVDYQLQNRINGFVVGGTTGESPTLHREQGMINKRVIKRVRSSGRDVPVIVGAGDYDTATAVQRTLEAFEDGADATLHVMGYYNKPPQIGIRRRYFDPVSEAAHNLPIIMYNIQPRGAAEYKPSTMIELAKAHPNIIGVKEASGATALDVAKTTRQHARDAGFDRHSFKILSGDDDKTYALMSDPEIEGVGVISVMSNLLPGEYQRFAEFVHDGKYNSQETLLVCLEPLNGMVGLTAFDDRIGEEDTFRNPIPVKAAAYLLGMISSPAVRPPLDELPEDGYQEVGRRLASAYLRTPDSFDTLGRFFRVDVGQRLKPYVEAIGR